VVVVHTVSHVTPSSKDRWRATVAENVPDTETLNGLRWSKIVASVNELAFVIDAEEIR